MRTLACGIGIGIGVDFDVLSAETIGYHAHKLKMEYQQSLRKELGEIEKETGNLEGKLKSKWGEQKNSIEG